MKRVAVTEAIGQVLAHDITRIIIGVVKDTPFRRGHVISDNDIEILLQLGKEHVFIQEPGDELVLTHMLHEEEVALNLYELCANESLYASEIHEGKIEAMAAWDGMLSVDVGRLQAINSIGDLTIVTKFTHKAVKKDDKVAGMRCIPLWLNREQVEAAREIWQGIPLLQIKPFVRKRVGLVTTGTEVATGRITDAFRPIIEERILPFGMSVIAQEIVADDTEQIVTAIETVKAVGADIVFCTGGMSVDPDDLTPGAMARSAAQVVTYGLPVLPGSMVCIAYMADGTPLVGLPGGVLFSKPTAFDILLPRLAADDLITKADCVALGHGGLQ